MAETASGAERTFEILGGASGLVSLVAFAYIGQILFEGILIGVVAGVLVGAGEYLFIPSLLQAQGDEEGFGGGETVFGFNRMGLGMGLATGGVVTLAGGFIFESQPALAVAIGVAVAVLDAVVLSVIFGRLGSGE